MKKHQSYEEAIREIEKILSELENGDPKVEEMGKMAQRATELLKYCQDKLRGIEKEISDNLDIDIDSNN